jgi:hypothetical protein
MKHPPAAGGEPPIIQYWHKEEIPSEVARLIATFRECNPDLRHLVFHETTAEQLIAEHLTARELAAFRACAVPSMQGDYLRYCAAWALGGIYSDVSFRCLRSLRALVETTDRGELFRREDTGTVINGFFLFKEPGHPLLRLSIDVATTNIERRAADQVNMVTGPWVFNGLLELRRAGSLEMLQQPGIDPSVAPLMESFHEAIGDYARVEAAFDGIRIMPLGSTTQWIGRSEERLAYKQGDLDWVNWHRRGETIFRAERR